MEVSKMSLVKIDQRHENLKTVLKARDSQNRICANDLHAIHGGVSASRPKNFLSTKQSEAIVEEISKGGILPFDIKLGNGGGTWMCPELAVEYCRWLDPVFGIQANQLVYAVATDMAQVAAPKALTMEELCLNFLTLSKEKKEQGLLLAKVEAKNVAMIAAVTEAMIAKKAEGSLNFSEWCTSMGSKMVGRNNLFKWMRLKGFVHQKGTNPLPSQTQVDMGNLIYIVTTYVDEYGITHIYKQTHVTVKGIPYFIKRMVVSGLIPDPITGKKWEVVDTDLATKLFLAEEDDNLAPEGEVSSQIEFDPSLFE